MILIWIEILNKLVKDLISGSQNVILGRLLIFPKYKQKFIRESVIKCYTQLSNENQPTGEVNFPDNTKSILNRSEEKMEEERMFSSYKWIKNCCWSFQTLDG